MSHYPIPKHAKTVLAVLFGLIVLLFLGRHPISVIRRKMVHCLDSLNRSVKITYWMSTTSTTDHRSSGGDFHARMFYAQRNMYLTGFTLFLSL